MKILIEKLKEASMSVLPIVAIVLILFFTPIVDLTTAELVTFLVSTVFLILGIALFTLGADLAMTPMGHNVGSGLAKKRKLGLLLVIAFLLGLLITIAEPDLKVLSEQVKAVINPTLLMVGIAVGVGSFIVFAIIRIIFKKNLSNLLMLFYMLLFALGMLVLINGNGDLLPLSFDSGGVTTGPITVPFIMALGIGVAKTIGGKNVNENSFGLVAMCSVGPILAVVLIGVTAFGVYYVSTYGRTLTSSDFEFEIVSSSKIAITKYIGDEEDVVIPATYKKYEVVSIEYKAFEYSIVETVEFESGKITIKGKAFYHCEELLSIVDENGAVRTAEKDAFYKCPSLEEVILPKAKVLTGAFVECDVLTSLSVNSVEGEELSECGAPTSLTTFSIATGELSDIFFDGYSKITTLTLSNDAYVSNSCFQDLPKLKKLYVGPNAIVSPSGLKQYSSLDLYLHVDYSEYSARDYKKQNSNINVYDYE